MFTWKEYAALLADLKSRGYQKAFFDSKPVPKEKTVYLRHDVDTDIFGIREMAQIEHAAGMESTWFFLTDSPLYNILSEPLLKLITELTETGHQCGLHIDGVQYASEDALAEDLARKYDYYSQYLPLSHSFSFHRPLPNMLSGITIPGFPCAYETRFFREIAYVSDSFRRPFMQQERLGETLAAGGSIQLLTHPVWWNEEELVLEEALRTLNGIYLHENYRTILETIYPDDYLAKMDTKAISAQASVIYEKNF